MSNPSGRIVETASGFDVVVDGVRHGTWANRAAAGAALEAEMRRAKNRKIYKPDPVTFSYRASVAGFPSECVDAASEAEAMRMLKCTSIHNLQIFRNGSWQWVA